MDFGHGIRIGRKARLGTKAPVNGCGSHPPSAGSGRLQPVEDPEQYPCPARSRATPGHCQSPLADRSAAGPAERLLTRCSVAAAGDSLALHSDRDPRLTAALHWNGDRDSPLDRDLWRPGRGSCAAPELERLPLAVPPPGTPQAIMITFKLNNKPFQCGDSDHDSEPATEPECRATVCGTVSPAVRACRSHHSHARRRVRVTAAAAAVRFTESRSIVPRCQ